MSATPIAKRTRSFFEVPDTIKSTDSRQNVPAKQNLKRGNATREPSRRETKQANRSKRAAPDEGQVTRAKPAKILKLTSTKGDAQSRLSPDGETAETDSKIPQEPQRSTEAAVTPQEPATPPESEHDEDDPSMKGPTLFKGLRFFLIPPARKSRVMQAKTSKLEKYGAEISERPDEHTTHIIVDQSMTKDHISKSFSEMKLPSKAKFVDFSWTIDSIESNVRKATRRYELPLNAFKPEANKEVPETSQNKRESPTDSKPRDELDSMVERVKEGVKVESDDEEDEVKAHKHTKEDWINKFLCVNGGRKGPTKTGEPNPNHQAITILSMLLHQHEGTGDDYRQLAYRKALTSLRACNEPIHTAAQAQKLPGIGYKLAKKIEEIYKTGKLEELDFREAEGQAKVLDLFQGIYGVGPKTAMKWYREGLRTLDDVRNREDLSENQRVSLEHYDDLQERIPRAEAAEHFEIVRKTLQEIDPEVEPMIMGSYRRGQPDCGDIDIIMTKPHCGRKELAPILYELLNKLYDMGFAKYTFGGVEAYSPRWLGVSSLPGSNKWRRMDILLVPWNERAGFLIYYTGNEIFNRSIRMLADRKGYHLNEKGLFLKGSSKKQLGALVEGHDEKEIFRILDVPYREPTERNIS